MSLRKSISYYLQKDAHCFQCSKVFTARWEKNPEEYRDLLVVLQDIQCYRLPSNSCKIQKL